MNAYYDTGVWVALYVEEAFSSAISAFVEARKQAIQINYFQRLEFENAIRLKVFRGDMPAEKARRVFFDLGEDLNLGRLIMRPLDWDSAFEQARSVSTRVTVRTGCRTLDLIHVAIALQWECNMFVSADARQLEAADREGLTVVDVRRLPQG